MLDSKKIGESWTVADEYGANFVIKVSLNCFKSGSDK